MKITLETDDLEVAVLSYIKNKLGVAAENVDLSKLKGMVTIDLPANSQVALGGTILDVLPNKAKTVEFKAPKVEPKTEVIEPIKQITPTPVEEVKEILEEAPVEEVKETPTFAGFDKATAIPAEEITEAPIEEVVEEAPIGKPVAGAFDFGNEPAATGNMLFVPPVVE